MTGLTGFEITALVFVIFLAVVVVALFTYLLRRLRSRRTKLLGELDNRPDLSQDRAFNRLAMARREAKLLSDQGVDVQRAQELIAEGQGAFDTRRFDQAYQSAQSAHEALVNARQRGSRSTGAPLPSAGSGSANRPGTTGPSAGVAAVPAAAAAPAEPEPHPSIAKNQAESQFQIRLLGEELSGIPPRRARDPNTLQAKEWQRQASDAFAKGDFTGAFRFALKGRRALGATLETLPPTGPLAAPEAGNGSSPTPDLAVAAETVAGGERCPECGYPALAGDAFCRGCGKPRRPLTCPSCGAPRNADEAFCGRCGARFP